ncbi:hypothetical protein [Streptomyces sp. NPDC047014]|uniref:hypothetical protein n=1 Tax=Streptomyces sp. NPDC047014 TaxID=3155736 RepID=UPI003404C1D6
MTAQNTFAHPRWGLEFHWWAVDPARRVGLFYSAFGPVPAAANAHVVVMDDATAQAKALHPEWFGTQHCSDDECPETHCPVELNRGPYLFTWDEEYDDRYTRYGVPKAPVLASELPGRLAAAALLVEVDFLFEQAARIDLSYPGGREFLSGAATTGSRSHQRP